MARIETRYTQVTGITLQLKIYIFYRYGKRSERFCPERSQLNYRKYWIQQPISTTSPRRSEQNNVVSKPSSFYIQRYSKHFRVFIIIIIIIIIIIVIIIIIIIILLSHWLYYQRYYSSWGSMSTRLLKFQELSWGS